MSQVTLRWPLLTAEAYLADELRDYRSSTPAANEARMVPPPFAVQDVD